MNEEHYKYHELLNEANVAASKGRLPKKSDEDLAELLSVCRQHSAGNPHSRVYDSTIAALQEEIDRREKKRLREDQDGKHKQLKNSVDKLHTPHKLHWWLLAVAILTMVFAGISALPVMREWFPAFQPVDKAANSPLPQSSSTPETPTTNKISPIAPAATQGTNNLGK